MAKYRTYAKLWLRMTVIVLVLFLAINLTGCTKRYVVVDGTETIAIKKSVADQLYRDNEALLKALEECKKRK